MQSLEWAVLLDCILLPFSYLANLMKKSIQKEVIPLFETKLVFFVKMRTDLFFLFLNMIRFFQNLNILLYQYAEASYQISIFLVAEKCSNILLFLVQNYKCTY